MSGFKIPIEAVTPEQARALTFDRHQREIVSHVTDTLDGVRSSIESKLVRVRENRALYADKIDEYIEILRKIEALVAEGQDDAYVIAEAMMLHGDTRVIDKRRVCAIEARPRRWLVFGIA